MTPRPAATASKHVHTSTQSPFDRIAECEKHEEQRLQEAVDHLHAERIDAEKGMTDAEKHAEEKLREEAMKHLTECKEEIGKELEKNEGNVKDELMSLEALYKKNAPALVTKQAETLLSLTI